MSIDEQARKLSSILDETQALRCDTRAVLNQIQGEVSLVEVRTCDAMSDTSVTDIFPSQHSPRQADMRKTTVNVSTEVQRDPRTVKTMIGQLEKETQAIKSGLSNMEQCRSAEHRTIRDLLLAVGKSQGGLANRLGYLETDPTSQIEPTMRPKTSMIALSSTRRQGRNNTPGRIWKNVHWKWSIYKLPIGVLCIESSHETAFQSSNPESLPEDRTSITFTFAPSKWIWNSLINVCYAMSTEGHTLPYWQRTQSGAMSMLPPRLIEYLRDGDLMSLGGLFSDFSCHEVDNLERYLRRDRRSIHHHPYSRPALEMGKGLVLSTATSHVTCLNPAKFWSRQGHTLYLFRDGKQLPLLFVLPIYVFFFKQFPLTSIVMIAQDDVGIQSKGSDLGQVND